MAISVASKMTNQENYRKSPDKHNSLSLDSTLYLAYRDIDQLLSEFFYKDRKQNSPIEFLDFGCGAGLSTQIYAEKLLEGEFAVNITGVDLNAENIKNATAKLPNANFICARQDEPVIYSKKFDLIVCNFVLVEMRSHDMQKVISVMSENLSKNGILIITNTTEEVYHPGYSWYGFTAEFPENLPQYASTSPQRYDEDHPVKVQVFSNKNRDQDFIFFDYFHSESAYKKAYEIAGLKLLTTYKPLGNQNDGIAWKAETKIPPYVIHILSL